MKAGRQAAAPTEQPASDLESRAAGGFAQVVEAASARTCSMVTGLTKNLYLSRLSTAASSLIKFSLVGGCVSSTCSTCAHRHTHKHTTGRTTGRRHGQSAPFAAQHNLHAVSVLQTKKGAASACGSCACLALHLLDALDTSPCQLHANCCPCKPRVPEPVCGHTPPSIWHSCWSHIQHNTCVTCAPTWECSSCRTASTDLRWWCAPWRPRPPPRAGLGAGAAGATAAAAASLPAVSKSMPTAAPRSCAAVLCANAAARSAPDGRRLSMSSPSTGLRGPPAGPRAPLPTGMMGCRGLGRCTTRHTPDKNRRTHQYALHSGDRHTETRTARNASWSSREPVTAGSCHSACRSAEAGQWKRQQLRRELGSRTCVLAPQQTCDRLLPAVVAPRGRPCGAPHARAGACVVLRSALPGEQPSALPLPCCCLAALPQRTARVLLQLPSCH